MEEIILRRGILTSILERSDLQNLPRADLNGYATFRNGAILKCKANIHPYI